LISPFGFVGLSEKSTSQSKPQQSLVVRSQSSKGTPGSRYIDLPKSMKFRTMLNLRSNHLIPRPGEPHFNLSKIALMNREAAKRIMD